MEQEKSKKNMLVFVLLFIFTILVAILINNSNIFSGFRVPNDSKADTSANTHLVLTSPSSVAYLNPGTEIQVGFRISGNTNISGAELTINYDKNVFEGLGINEQADVLALGKTINNNIGKMSVDIVKSGPGNFPVNSNLVIFRFKYLAKSGATSITVAPESTVGIPNQIGGKGSLILRFCIADYNNDLQVNLIDFQVFGQNYKQTGIDCSLDLVENDCYLDIRDFSAFGQVYKVAEICN